MIPDKIQDYVKVYENHVPKELCESATKKLESVNWDTHRFYNSKHDSYVSYDKELSISNDNIEERAELSQYVWKALERYILTDFSSFSPWFCGWAGHTYVRFNRYTSDTQMKIHCDHIHSMFDGNRKGVPFLTVLGALNNEYEGGDFVMFGDKKVEMPSGAVVVFPSNFMFPHEVKPVTSGVRYSYVSWAW